MTGEQGPPVKNILVAEDDDRLREVLEEWLSATGYRPITAQDGIEALDWLGRLPIDLMIVDILMPHLDGSELIKRVRKEKQWGSIPIILLSGYGNLDPYRHLAVNVILPKPFDIHVLLREVQALIGPPGAASPGGDRVDRGPEI